MLLFVCISASRAPAAPVPTSDCKAVAQAEGKRSAPVLAKHTHASLCSLCASASPTASLADSQSMLSVWGFGAPDPKRSAGVRADFGDSLVPCAIITSELRPQDKA